MHSRKLTRIFWAVLVLLVAITTVLIIIHFSRTRSTQPPDAEELHRRAYDIGERMTSGQTDAPVSEDEKQAIGDRLSGSDSPADSGTSHYSIGSSYDKN